MLGPAPTPRSKDARMNSAWTRHNHLRDKAQALLLQVSESLGTPEYPDLLQRYLDTVSAAAEARAELRKAVQHRTKVVQEITGRFKRRVI
jgi:hypothetical protein